MQWSKDEQFKKAEALMDATKQLRKEWLRLMEKGNLEAAAVVLNSYEETLVKQTAAVENLMGQIRGADRYLSAKLAAEMMEDAAPPDVDDGSEREHAAYLVSDE